MLLMQNNVSDVILLLSVAQINFLTLKEKIILQKNLDSADALALLSINDIASIIGRIPGSVSWNGAETIRIARLSERIMRKCSIAYMPYFSPLYPALLREVPDAPFMLFYRGCLDILYGQTVSVVGTRRLTPAGSKAAYSFAYEAAVGGCTVVSGLAYGADGKAHEGAVAAFPGRNGNTCGHTAAVLPGGIDTIVPQAHTRLAVRILETGGCILSEYLPGVPAEPWRFVQRNRIIAALSPATVVIQAPPGSGALLTAGFAVDYNRDLLFHTAAFCAEAETVAQTVRNHLQTEVSRGKSKRWKLENTPEKYLYDGAPVIKDYNDYRLCLAEAPGERSDKVKEGQLPLF